MKGKIEKSEVFTQSHTNLSYLASRFGFRLVPRFAVGTSRKAAGSSEFQKIHFCDVIAL